MTSHNGGSVYCLLLSVSPWNRPVYTSAQATLQGSSELELHCLGEEIVGRIAAREVGVNSGLHAVRAFPTTRGLGSTFSSDSRLPSPDTMGRQHHRRFSKAWLGPLSQSRRRPISASDSIRQQYDADFQRSPTTSSQGPKTLAVSRI